MSISTSNCDESGAPSSDKDNLPALYRQAAETLNLAPSQHAEKPFKKILGGAASLVDAMSTLRNQFSDAHARGEKAPVKLSPRHAHLAVNASGAIAVFLVETFLARQEQSRAEDAATDEPPCASIS